MDNATATLQKFIQSLGWTNILWATDIDGTLADFHSDPKAVRIPGETLQDLNKINALTQGGLCAITGRDLDFVQNYALPGLQIIISAEHHTVLKDALGEVHALVPLPRWEFIDKNLQTEAAKLHPRIWIEAKQTSRTLHYRDVPETSRGDIGEKAEKLSLALCDSYNAAAFGDRLQVKKGAFAFEIGPPQDKGKALHDIMRGFPGRTPLFFGDSPADLEGGKAALDLKGVFVSVGPDKDTREAATLHFDTPADLRAAIHEIIRTRAP